jgi:putative membrane-bound dehydrogenase-like protein
MLRLLKSAPAVGLIALVLFSVTAAEPPGKSPAGPRSPREELATFRVLDGFKVELAASEPDVIDPVAMSFDADGRLYVCEMRGYPNGGVATGTITSGRVRLLEDRDGDGVFERSTVFAENLRFPTGVLPWKGGVLVANAPEILNLEDTDGDGKADRRRALYAGFNLANIQQIVNSLQWGLDNWVYGVAGSDGGTVTSPEKPDAPAVTLRNRGIRFRPDRPASLEPTSGGGQYGLTPDDWQRYFTATNSQHLRHIVLPDHYLRRNPSLPVSQVTLDIPEHGAAAKVFRVSEFESWRVERTTRRKDSPDSKRFSPTELVPGGFITSACSPVVYAAELFPPPYRGNVFVCDPANNLVHRDILVEKGATFTARRGDTNCEFLASTDNWFRPVSLSIGPDGSLYVLDFYREAIETPLSLPEDIKAKMNLESRGRGRIWRISPKDAKYAKPTPLGKASVEELVAALDDGNIRRRLTAQQLLVERQERTAVEGLRKLTRDAKRPQGRAHALWTLHGLGALEESEVVRALTDTEAGVRIQALRLAEERLEKSEKVRTAAVKLADDPSPQVRFQAAFSLGFSDAPEAVEALAKVVRRDAADPWTLTAVLSSASHNAPGLLETLTADRDFIGGGPARLQVLTRLASLAGARGDAALARTLSLLSGGDAEPWRIAVLEGLGQGMQNSGRPLARLWEQPPAALKETVGKVLPFFETAVGAARDEKRPLSERVAAVRLVGYGPPSVGLEPLRELIAPQQPTEVQTAAARALAMNESPRVGELLLAPWPGYSPAVRREVVEALFARLDRLTALLDAVEANKVSAGQLEPARLEQLRKHPNAKLRQRAVKLLAGLGTPDRKKVVDDYRAALELKADAARGKAAFKKVCSTCHRLENEGTEVGPDLLAALRNKSPEQLLHDVLDPSREVDSRYLNYVLTTKSGRTLTGLIAAETASSVTLRRAERAEDTVLRGQIESIEATAKSVMPEGLEMQLTKQDLTDVIAYLQEVGRPK